MDGFEQGLTFMLEQMHNFNKVEDEKKSMELE
jgi:hypothetical protein